jgi:hypothetical protein
MTIPKPTREPHRATPPEVLALIGAIESERDAEIKNLLRRCGVTADLNDPNTFWIQFQAVGLQDLRLTQKEFEDGYLQVEIIAMLKRRVFEIERAAALQSGSSQRSVPQSSLRSRRAEAPLGGRPLGEPVDVNKLIALRGTRSKKAFAQILRMKLKTLERIEKTGRGSDASKRKIDKFLQKNSP